MASSSSDSPSPSVSSSGVGVIVGVSVIVGVGVLVGVGVGGGGRTVVSSTAMLLSVSICSVTRLMGRSTRTTLEMVVSVAVTNEPVTSMVAISPAEKTLKLHSRSVGVVGKQEPPWSTVQPEMMKPVSAWLITFVRISCPVPGSSAPPTGNSPMFSTWIV